MVINLFGDHLLILLAIECGCNTPAYNHSMKRNRGQFEIVYNCQHVVHNPDCARSPEKRYAQMSLPPSPSRSNFINNVLKLVSGTTAAQAITIFTAPIISRLFVPETFGILNVFTALLTIISVVVCLRYEFAIVLPEDDEDAVSLVGLCIIIAIFISILIGIILLIFARPLANLFRATNLYPFLWLIPIGLLIQGFFQAFNYWNTRTKHFGRLSIARVSASLTTSAFPILLGSIGHATAASLVFSYIAGVFVYAGVLIIQVLGDSAALFSRFLSKARMRINLKRYKKFPLVDSWGAFINNLSWQLPALMLLFFFSEKVVGYYSLSNRLILFPLTLLGNSIAQVFYQRSAELRANPANLSKSVELVFHRLTTISLYPALVLGICGPELFAIVFGENWIEAGRYTQILSPWMFVLFISTPLGNLFAALERQELSLSIYIVILLTRFGSLAIGGLTQNIYLTLGIWSVSGVLVYGGLAFWLLYLTKVRWSSAFRSILAAIMYASLPGLLQYVGLKIGTQSAIFVILLTLSTTLIYYCLVIARDHQLRGYLLSALSQIKTRA
jgi:lipopolysaccharide exporter